MVIPPRFRAHVLAAALVLALPATLAGCTASGPSARTSAGSTPAPATSSAPSSSASTTQSSGPSDTGTTPAPTTSAPVTSAASDSAPPASSPASGSAAPAPRVLTVTYQGWDAATQEAQAAGYVPGRDVPPGQCTLVLTKGSLQASASRTATSDVRTTDCGTLVIAGSKLAAGTWTGTLSYRGGAGDATSAPFTVTVP